MFSKFAVRVALVLLVGWVCGAFAQTNVLTYHNDNFHTGQNLTETLLSPASVNPSNFATQRLLQTDGQVEGEPLYVSSFIMADHHPHNVIFAATEHDSVYAFDADSGTTLWQISLLLSDETPSDPRACSQVYPEIGVTATPVIDLKAGPHGTIYLVAMTKSAGGQYAQRLHALDIWTGNEEFGGPVPISATVPGRGDDSAKGALPFDPKMYKERAALLLSGGVVYTSWSSHCDIRPYTGWVIGYDQYSLRQTMAFNFTPNGEGGTIWGGGAGPAADNSGNLFFQLANGTFDTTLDAMGFPSSGDYGNSFIKLSPGFVPLVQDYWTMENTVDESDADIDLGSGGIMLLPDVTDYTSTVRHLGVGAGKDGNLYVFDRDSMGKFEPDSNGNLYQELRGVLTGAGFTTPAWFNTTVYFGSVGDSLRAFPIVGGLLSIDQSTRTRTTFEYPGTTPSISANGTQNGIVWAIENLNPAVLHAYDASNLANELYNSANQNGVRCGGGVKWIPPTIADGKVFVPTTTGVCVFALVQNPCPTQFRPICPETHPYCGCPAIAPLRKPAAP